MYNCTESEKKDQHLILIFSRWFYAWFLIMKGLKDLPLFWQTDYRSLKYVFIIIWSGSNCVFVFFTWLHSDSCFNSSMVLSVILLLSIKRFFMNIFSHQLLWMFLMPVTVSWVKNKCRFVVFPASVCLCDAWTSWELYWLSTDLVSFLSELGTDAGPSVLIK